MGCLPYPPRLKSCLREATPTNPCPVRFLQDVSLTHPGWNGAYGNISHKPVPSMLYTGCFTYTSKLKWCLQEHLPQTSAQYATYRMFLLHIQAEMVPTGTPPKNQFPVCYIQDVSLTHPGWNGAYSKHLPQNHAQIPMGCFFYTSRLKWCLWITLTNPCPSQYLLDVSLTHPD